MHRCTIPQYRCYHGVRICDVRSGDAKPNHERLVTHQYTNTPILCLQCLLLPWSTSIHLANNNLLDFTTAARVAFWPWSTCLSAMHWWFDTVLPPKARRHMHALRKEDWAALFNNWQADGHTALFTVAIMMSLAGAWRHDRGAERARLLWALQIKARQPSKQRQMQKKFSNNTTSSHIIQTSTNMQIHVALYYLRSRGSRHSSWSSASSLVTAYYQLAPLRYAGFGF